MPLHTQIRGRLRRGLAVLALGVGGLVGCSGQPRVAATQQLEDPYFADERRQGIVRTVATPAGRRPPYTERFERLAADDPSPLVRATAIRALNRARWTAATPRFSAAIGDPSPLVRVEACKALANVPDDAAAEALIARLADAEESTDVRIAAADALRHYRALPVARALAAQLQARDFGVAWQAHKSLRALAGEDFGYDEAAWLQHFTRAPQG